MSRTLDTKQNDKVKELIHAKEKRDGIKNARHDLMAQLRVERIFIRRLRELHQEGLVPAPVYQSVKAKTTAQRSQLEDNNRILKSKQKEASIRLSELLGEVAQEEKESVLMALNMSTLCMDMNMSTFRMVMDIEADQ